MGPAPARKHQKIALNLARQIDNFLEKKKGPCQVYIAPFDVVFPETGEDAQGASNVVQPDISIICDEKKLNEKGCLGAPDLIIEILSPFSATRDLIEKFSLYERHRVLEYWVVYPDEKMVMVFRLGENSEYGKPKVYSGKDKIAVPLIGELEIDLSVLEGI